jgi:hypothetical protein
MNEPDLGTPVMPVFGRDSVEIRMGDSSPFGEAQLEFAGDGTLSFDPAAPDRLLAVRVSEPELAPTTLSAALGKVATQRLTAMRDSGEVVGPITVRPTASLEPLARLALASWLDQWSPLDIPRQAGAADVGAAAHAARHPLLALRSFSVSAAYLVALSEHALGRLESPPPAVLVALADTLTAARISLGAEHHLHDDLARLAGQAESAIAGAVGDVTARLRELHDQALMPVHGAAVDAHVGALFSVDWAMVPARVLSPSDGAIHMTRADTGITITVEAAKFIDSGELLGLSARLIDPESGKVLATAPLLRDASGARFTAGFPYSEQTASVASLDAALPEVYSDPLDGPVPGPRLGTDRAEADAWRNAVTALMRLRRSHAAAAALGGPLPGEIDAAGKLVGGAEMTLKRIETADAHQASLKAWRRALRGPLPSGSSWPSGLLVPGAGVGRPLLSEMLEVWDPTLFEAARA